MTDSALHRLRRQRDAARSAVGVAAGRLAAARDAAREATRTGAAAAASGAVAQEGQAAAALRAARAAEAAVREQLAGAVAALGESPVEQIGTLQAAYPVVFLPVRLETRFRPNPNQPGGQLLVRIYPDAILADQHEPLLTATEVAAGQGYWRRAFRDGGERDAWAALLGEATAPRAAWIVERTTPANVGQLGSGAEPVFGALETRPEGWHRAPEARGLPERWIVTALAPGERHQVIGAPVREGLALSLRLSGDGDQAADAVDLSGDGLEVEPELAWVYDFEAAEQAGMAVRLPLNVDQFERGFDTLLVVGVRTGEPPGEQAGELERLLDSHRFSRGLAFVPQGARTNNTAGYPAAWPVADPAGATSFPVARGPALAGPGSDGRRVAAALGIGTGPLDHVLGADRDEQTPAQAMADALWPATIGYFLDQMMARQLTREVVDATRAWLRAWVRPRGPLPALRVGAVPYGLLPVGALDTWASPPEEGAPPRLVELLRRVAPVWSELAASAPHVGRSGDPDADLVELLGLDASTQSVKVRRSFGYDVMWNALTFSSTDMRDWERLQRAAADQLLELLGQQIDTFDHRALYLSHLPFADDFAGPLVTSEPLSETDPLAPDYVTWLRAVAPEQLKDQAAPAVPGAGEPPGALLYLLLRHALLAEYDRAARRLLRARQLALRHEDREPELVGILTTGAVVVQPQGTMPPVRTAWERFALQVPEVTGNATLGAWLADPSLGPPPADPEVAAIVAGLAAYRASLQALVGLPTAELERLFTETLDACSHRLDAWVTSLAASRLATLRGQAPGGVYLGCYGWVHDLRPDPPAERVEVVLGDGSTALARTDSGGYVYAPSMLHGATAAVLRSAYLSRSGPQQRQYAVDLSSRRVRVALGLLDAVRDGQPLGAVLGYQFERGLHEGHPGVELDRFIDAFRGLYPQVANKAQDSGEPAEAVAARNVVDGLRLLRAWQAGQVPFGSGELPASGPQRDAIEAELRRLEDAVDALGDLLLAESVHQVVKGSPAGAAATLDTLAKGQRPPEPEVATVPRSGTVLHQRVVLLLGDGSTGPGWETVPGSPRAAAAKELNAWLGRLLGPPAGFECRATSEGGPPRTVSLRDLDLQPVDLLLLVQAAGSDGGPAELDRRVAWLVAGDAGPDVPVTIDHQTATSAGALPLAVAFELAAAAGRLLGFGRALEPADLLPPERQEPAADPMTAELTARAGAARTALGAARSALASAAATAAATPQPAPAALATLRAALVKAAGLGVAGAWPASRHAADEPARQALLDQAASAGAELNRRVAASAAAADAGTPAAALREVFGGGLPVVPRFRPAAPALLTPALAAEPDLGPEAGAAVEGWLAQLARVRPPLDAWREARVLARALGRLLPRPRIVHLPLERGPDSALPRWAALPYPSQDQRPRSGLVNLALLGAAPPAATQPWAGLLLDTWPELLPSAEEDAGVVFHFDAPRVEAPQAVLLAVPSRPGSPGDPGRWSYEELERVLLGTLDLARVRALDLGHLGRLGQLLPMTFLARNTADDAVSTSFAGHLVRDPIILQE
jgi:hypothetical protein